MKIAKGTLSEADESPRRSEAVKPNSASQPGGDVEKNRLFQTLEEETPSERNYIKLLSIVVVVVIICGAVISYLMLPGVGDQVRVSREVEMAVRDHFLLREKRTATDITFYQCDGFYGARVEVETRTDIPNPIYKIPAYSARVTANGGEWSVTAQPITSPDMDKPCF